MEKELKFAILIDADNISEKYIKIILDETAKSGVATYKRIYGDWTNPQLSRWKKVLLDNSIMPIQQYSYTTGKSATDSAMIIDAMDILYSGNVDGFCLCSSDSDFTRLAARLREDGKQVIGMGESKTPKAFISACNQFKYIDLLYTSIKNAEKAEANKEKERARQAKAEALRQEAARQEAAAKAAAKKQTRSQKKRHSKDPAKETPVPVEEKLTAEAAAEETVVEPAKVTVTIVPEETENFTVAAPAEVPEEKEAPVQTENETSEEEVGPQTDLATIKREILNLVEECSDDDGWIFSAELGNQLAKRFPDFDVRNYGYKKFTSFINSTGLFEMKRTPAAGNSNVHLVYFKIK